MNKGTILSVDDDANLQIVIGQYLEDDGYTVLKAGDAKTAIDRVGTASLDVILLDLTLPDAEGLTLIPQFRTRTNAAIIVVSGKIDTMEKIVCLEMGADDYITKPFEMRELSARIKAVLRRIDAGTRDLTGNDSRHSGKKAEHILFNGGWCLDRTQYQLFDPDKKSAALTSGEFALLDALMTAANRALSRQQLFELTRDGDYDVYDRAIDIQVARLRKKLGDDTKSPQIIKTIRGVGYMFCGDVSA